MVRGNFLSLKKSNSKYKRHINRMHSDSKKRRSFLALLFAAGEAGR